MVARPDSVVFAALADPTRLELVERLQSAQPLSTTQLAESLPISRQAVRKHLDVLAIAGLVHDHRQGRQRLWELDARPLREVRDWADSYRALWEARLDRLDAFLLTQADPNGDSDV